MKKTSSKLFVVPYMLWIALFVLAPLVLIFGQSFFNIEGQFSLENYKSYFASQNLTYLKMSFNSVLYAGIVTFVTLLISYPTALFLTRLKHRQLWLMLIILPTWINLLLKAYAFIGFLVKMALLTNSWNLSELVHNSCFYRFFLYLCRKLHRAPLYDFADFQCLRRYG